MKAGTLVMLVKHEEKFHANQPEVGAIGEVVDHSGKVDWRVRSGCIVVSFPRNISQHSTGYWQFPRSSLVPISGPDIEIGDYEDAPVEERLLETEN